MAVTESDFLLFFLRAAEEVTVCEGKEQTIGCQGDQVLEIMLLQIMEGQITIRAREDGISSGTLTAFQMMP